MKITNVNCKPVTGCVTWQIGHLTVSVSNVFGVTSTTCVFGRDSLSSKPLKEFSGNGPETVIKAIRWAQRHLRTRSVL